MGKVTLFAVWLFHPAKDGFLGSRGIAEALRSFMVGVVSEGDISRIERAAVDSSDVGDVFDGTGCAGAMRCGGESRASELDTASPSSALIRWENVGPKKIARVGSPSRGLYNLLRPKRSES
jgi:hypothetical protein